MAATHTNPTATMTKVIFVSQRLWRFPIFLNSSFMPGYAPHLYPRPHTVVI